MLKTTTLRLVSVICLIYDCVAMALLLLMNFSLADCVKDDNFTKNLLSDCCVYLIDRLKK